MDAKAVFIALCGTAFLVFALPFAPFVTPPKGTETVLLIAALWAVCWAVGLCMPAKGLTSTRRSRAVPRIFSLGGVIAIVLVAGACSDPPSSADETADTVGEKVYVTAYTWFDNTPPGSPAISHPVLHKTAGGTGTYDDPITLAVGHSLETGKDVLDYPAGTRIYLPDVRRYFIVEDTCGDGDTPEDGPCHTGAEKHGDASIWLDMWIGGEDGSERFARRCTREVTGVHTAVFDPAANYVVAAGHGVIQDGKCDSGYGNELVTR